MSQGKEVMKTPVHIIVSRASPAAIAAIEGAGGCITTRYYTRDSIRRIFGGLVHPVHSRQFRQTPLTKLIAPHQAFTYALSDPAKRKDLEYYRDISHRGYLSYQVPTGHGPSLFWRTPGTEVVSEKREAARKDAEENRIW
jgi:large subunit ribosomal protein L15